MRIGAINPNVFGDDAYRLGSLCNPDGAVRRRALDHCLECIEIAGEVGSTVLSLWLADGTNYPGQDSLRGRYARLTASLDELYAALPDGLRLLVEYKFFEPGFFSTDLPDWGTAALSAGGSARRRRCSSTPATTRRARMSSRSSRCCSPKGCSAASTSTTASTPTTT